MRRGSLLILVGIALVVLGVAQSWYYVTYTYPAQEDQLEKNCLSYHLPAQCVSLAPAEDQSPFGLGVFISVIGTLLALFGGVRFGRVTVLAHQQVHGPTKGA